MKSKQLDKPADIAQFLKDRYISKLMYLIWQSRKDLQHAFDLNSVSGQQGFCSWYEVSVLREHTIAQQMPKNSTEMADYQQALSSAFPAQLPLHARLMRLESAVSKIGQRFPMPFRNLGKAIWYRLLALTARMAGKSDGQHRIHHDMHISKPLPAGDTEMPGANLIGYAHAELGMGQHVRMTATALATTDIKFGVLNFNVGVGSRQQATLDHGELITDNIYRANIFHINADQMLKAFSHLGRDFFEHRYNILYPFWELAKWPDEWVDILGLVEEIWAPTRFIQNAIAERTMLPVEYMPMCVYLPPPSGLKRAHYGLPEDRFLFLFAFDFFSYIERKNPFATIRAFKKAFPGVSSKVGLVIKVMNGDTRNSEWIRMMQLIDGDPRIFVLNKTMTRQEVLDLYAVTDCFVSLHRSEGFGLGPAEAMYLKKPVIVTNYSGNTDFTLADNSCLVDYKLIPVERGQYIFENGQVWADPDVEHAAWYMRKLFDDEAFRSNLGERGAHLIHTAFSPATVARNYRKRLNKLNLA